MATYATKDVVKEVLEVVKANPMIEEASIKATVPLVQETNAIAAYVSLEREMLSIERHNTTAEAYDRTIFFLINLNVDCGEDEYLVFDVVNSLEHSILDDSQLWDKIVDRDIVTIEYDNSEFFPKRTATMLLQVKYRISC